MPTSSPPPARTLLLMRHAKSAWDDPRLTDFERPLNARGRRDAPRMGRWIANSALAPDVVLCSSAARTRETWELVGRELPDAPSPLFLKELYHASSNTIIDAVEQLQPKHRIALLLGHNPGMAEAVERLSARDAAAREKLPSNFPTAAVAIFSWEGEWEDLRTAEIALERLVRPKDLASGA